jgi:hypothetical protein
VTSRKLHGNFDVFDLALPLSASTGSPLAIEPRVSVVSGHVLIFTFTRDVISHGVVSVLDGNGVSLGAASVAITNNRFEVTLPPVPDGARVSIAVAGVNGVLDIGTTAGFLRGDVDGSGVVNGDDVHALKSRSGQLLDGTSFRYDVNLSGAIGAADISAVKARSGAALQ